MSVAAFHSPMLATLVDDVVAGPEWIYERKLDGIRIVVVCERGEVRLVTRNRNDRTSTYPELASALPEIGPERFVADGEIVAFDGNVTSFSRLQQRSGRDEPTQKEIESVPVVLYLFDLLQLGDDDLRDRPLRARKSRLREAIDFDDPVRFCPHRNGGDTDHARELLDGACRSGWEGLIAKRAESRYRSGRSRNWLKLKCVARQEFVIGGYTDPKGSRTGFGALLVGYHGSSEERHGDGGGGLRFAGRVGTGYDDSVLAELSSRLARRQRKTSPFTDAPDRDGVHWVTPDLVCEVGFTEWTTAGRLRHPRFLGLRHDKAADEVVREVPESAP